MSSQFTTHSVVSFYLFTYWLVSHPSPKMSILFHLCVSHCKMKVPVKYRFCICNEHGWHYLVYDFRYIVCENRCVANIFNYVVKQLLKLYNLQESHKNKTRYNIDFIYNHCTISLIHSNFRSTGRVLWLLERTYSTPPVLDCFCWKQRCGGIKNLWQ